VLGPAGHAAECSIWAELAHGDENYNEATIVEGAVMAPSFIAAYHAWDFRDALGARQDGPWRVAPKCLMIQPIALRESSSTMNR
jgi:hypothetical protein